MFLKTHERSGYKPYKYLVLMLAVLFIVAGHSTIITAGEVVINNWGGAFHRLHVDSYYDPFSESTGIDVIATSNVEMYARIEAMLQAGFVEWDVISNGSLPELINAVEKGLLEPIDYSIVSKDEELLVLPETWGFHEYGIPQDIGALALAYRADVFPEGEGPKGWEDFWNVEEFPGMRGVPNISTIVWEVLCFALLADGVPEEELFPMDLDRAFAKLDEIRDHIVWWSSGDESWHIVREEEVSMIIAWDARMNALIEQDIPVNVVYNQGYPEGTYWGVVKDSPNKEEAMMFLDWFLKNPENQAMFAEGMWVSTPHPDTYDYLCPEQHERFAMSPANRDKLIDLSVEDMKWIAEHADYIIERWMTWIVQ